MYFKTNKIHPSYNTQRYPSKSVYVNCIQKYKHTLFYNFNNNLSFICFNNTGHFIMFSVITNIYNKKTKGPTLMEMFTATGKLKMFFYN